MPKDGQNRKGRGKNGLKTADYRHQGATRKNVPPASIAAEGKVPYVAKARYHYSPHLPPVLRFDPTGAPDKLPGLIAEAGHRPLKPEEQKLLAEALRPQEPWLEWAGKRESDSVSEGRGFFDVDPVALHIHERVSAQAILKVAARQDVQRNLFADPQQAYHEAVQFYGHDIDWTNRLILGDSLQVMSSLARREDLAGKVQMIYIDPPYGIKFGSNFQPEVGKRDVREAESDLTREPEMVRAYRDTWRLGTHSYLAYLRDRLLAAKELLGDAGSMFIQIGEDNLHRVRMLMDDVFGADNNVCVITLEKTSGSTQNYLPSVTDYLLWYARDLGRIWFKQGFLDKNPGSAGGTTYTRLLKADGRRVPLAGPGSVDHGDRVYALSDLTSQSMGREKGEGAACWFPIRVGGSEVLPSGQTRWKTNQDGMARLLAAERVEVSGIRAGYVRFLEDFPVYPVTNFWDDVMSSFMADKRYVVQTNPKIIERCVLMTTRPGDLVVDPTCGGGTTAYVAEQWGRRWITIDTSRVAVAIARQRLMTAKYDYYRLQNEKTGVGGGFQYKTVPHVTLKSIAQNTNLDPILREHAPILDARLASANAALRNVRPEVRDRLLQKLLERQKAQGKKAVTDALRRRWELPKTGTWDHWEMPFDTDPDWPKELQEAVVEYRRAWRAKMDEVNACIAANAEQEELVDRPAVANGVIRVSGPFTVEAVQPPEISLDAGPMFGGEPEGLEAGFDVTASGAIEAENARAYLRQMLNLIRMDGVRFPDNKQMQWSRLEPLFESGSTDVFHAEGRWVPVGKDDEDAQGVATVGVVFGPQYGPVTAAMMVEEIVKPAARRYDDLVIAAFSFDGPAQAVIENASHPKLRIHMAHIRPDVNPGMVGLLKEQPGNQLFTVFGQPTVEVHGPGKNGASKGEYVVEMQGVVIYDPVKNEISPTSASKVAAWFLDSDYDGRTFCITQAFFPDRSAWEKLAKALSSVVDPERFEAFSGTSSLPFPPGAHRRIAVKVIDPRGNEVMATRTLRD